MMPDPSTSIHHPDPVELLTSRALRIGVWGSVFLFVAGLLSAVVAATAEFSEIVLQAGMILLIATPYLRVLSAIVGFSRERDRTFMAISMVVFLMLVGELMYAWLIR